MTTSTGDGGGMCLRVHHHYHHQNRTFRLYVGHCEVRDKTRKKERKREIVDQLISFRIFSSSFHNSNSF